MRYFNFISLLLLSLTVAIYCAHDADDTVDSEASFSKLVSMDLHGMLRESLLDYLSLQDLTSLSSCSEATRKLVHGTVAEFKDIMQEDWLGSSTTMFIMFVAPQNYYEAYKALYDVIKYKILPQLDNVPLEELLKRKDIHRLLGFYETVTRSSHFNFKIHDLASVSNYSPERAATLLKHALKRLGAFRRLFRLRGFLNSGVSLMILIGNSIYYFVYLFDLSSDIFPSVQYGMFRYIMNIGISILGPCIFIIAVITTTVVFPDFASPIFYYFIVACLLLMEFYLPGCISLTLWITVFVFYWYGVLFIF